MRTITESEYIADALADEFVIQAGYVTTATDRLANRDDEVDYVSVLDEMDRPAGKDTGINTVTYEQWLAGQTEAVTPITYHDTEYVDNGVTIDKYDVVHTVRVESTLMQVVNYEVLYTMQDRAVNYYTDKQGERRVGSCILRTLASGTPLAYCVKCKGSLIYRGDYDRESMEDFVLAVEAHGHNHSAKWVTKTTISTPIAMSVTHNPELVDAMNEALTDEQVLAAYDTIVPEANLQRFRRVNGFA